MTEKQKGNTVSGRDNASSGRRLLELLGISRGERRDETVSMLPLLYEGMGTSVAITTKEGRIVFWNRASEQLFGRSREEVVDKNILDILPGITAAVGEADVWEKVLGGGNWSGGVLLRNRRGESFRACLDCSPVMDGRGRVAGVLFLTCVLEHTLRDSEDLSLQDQNRFRLFVESANDIIYSLTPDGIFTYVSPGWLHALGHEHVEVVGKSFAEFVHPDDIPLCREFLETVLETGERQSGVEYRVRHKDGRWRWHESNGSPVLDTEGRVTGYIGVARDVTESKRQRELISLQGRMLDSVSDSIIGTDLEGHVIYWGRGAERLYCLTADEALGKEISALVPGLDPAEEKRRREAALEHGTWSDQYRQTGNDGSSFWVDTKIFPVRDEQGRPNGFIGIDRDITERIAAEHAIRDAYETISQSPAVVFVWENREGWPVSFVTTNVCNIFGYTAEDFTTGRVDYVSLIHPDDLERVISEVEDYSRDDSVKRFAHEPYRIITPEGSVRWVDDITRIQRDDNGNIARYKGIVVDITERLEAQRELRQRNTMARAMVEAASDAVLLLDREGRIIELNRSYARGVMRCEPEEVRGRVIWGLLDADYAADRKEKVSRVLETGEPVTYEHDYGERILEWNVYPISDSSGENTMVAAFGRDVTESRQLEHERIKAAKHESIGLLAGGIAHDFNNILSALLGNVSLAKAISTDEEISQTLADAEKAGERARRLTRQLLTFSKGGKPDKKVVNIVDLVRSSAEFALRGSAVKLVFEAGQEDIPVMADEGQIDQVVNNLAINARQAMENGGRLKVTLTGVGLDEKNSLGLGAGQYVMITFEDNGPGIDPVELEKIFEPHFTTKEKGSGLGLATTRSIIQRHGGRILVSSKPGKGARFTIYLETADNRTGGKAGESRSARVLVLDEDKDMMKVSRRMLEVLGHEVEAAGSLAEALEVCRKGRDSGRPCELAIVDLTKHKGEGAAETLERLREIIPGLRVIVSIEYDEGGSEDSYTARGFDGALKKPFMIEQLKTVLDDVLGKGRPGSEGPTESKKGAPHG